MLLFRSPPPTRTHPAKPRQHPPPLQPHLHNQPPRRHPHHHPPQTKPNQSKAKQTKPNQTKPPNTETARGRRRRPRRRRAHPHRVRARERPGREAAAEGPLRHAAQRHAGTWGGCWAVFGCFGRFVGVWAVGGPCVTPLNVMQARGGRVSAVLGGLGRFLAVFRGLGPPSTLPSSHHKPPSHPPFKTPQVLALQSLRSFNAGALPDSARDYRPSNAEVADLLSRWGGGGVIGPF